MRPHYYIYVSFLQSGGGTTILFVPFGKYTSLDVVFGSRMGMIVSCRMRNWSLIAKRSLFPSKLDLHLADEGPRTETS